MTKFTDFQDLGTGKNGSKFASVLVTKTFLWFKQSERKTVYCPGYSSFYHWLDTGEYCPTDVVDRLSFAYYAQKEIEDLLHDQH